MPRPGCSAVSISREPGYRRVGVSPRPGTSQVPIWSKPGYRPGTRVFLWVCLGDGCTVIMVAAGCWMHQDDGCIVMMNASL